MTAASATTHESSLLLTLEEISQLVSHLTWARVDVHELRPQDWSHTRVKAIHDGVRAKAEEFFRALPEERRAWFSSDVFPNEYKHWMP